MAERAEVAVFLTDSSDTVQYRAFFFEEEINGDVVKRPQRVLSSIQAFGDYPLLWNQVKESAEGTSAPFEISIPLVVGRRFTTRASDLAASGSICDDTILKVTNLLPTANFNRHCRVYYNGYQNDGGSWDYEDCWLVPTVRMRQIMDGQDVRVVTTLNFVGPK
jgi:hypothetical protein